MAEWPKAAVSKTAEGISPPWVRIPFSPPVSTCKSRQNLDGVWILPCFYWHVC